MSLSEGLNWINNQKKKIKEVLLTSSPFQMEGYGSKEGFAGILGPSIIDITNEQETAKTNGLTTSLQVDLQNYATANQALQEKTNKYLNSVPDTQGRNYNIFINKSVDYGDIKSTLDKSQCVDTSVILGSGLQDVGAAFYTAYPNNFSSVMDANDACKLWAADAGVPNFSIGKSTDNSTYTCHVGTFSGKPSQYSVPQVAYVIASSNDATLGGLFLDGTIGVYNADASDNAAVAADTSAATAAGIKAADKTNGKSASERAADKTKKMNNLYNVQLMKGSSVPNGYAVCDRFIGGALVAQSVLATLGANCSGDIGTPFDTRYVTIWSNPKNPDGYIQIAQIAVYSYSDGKIINVAPGKTATDGWGNQGYQGQSPAAMAIDGDLSNKKAGIENSSMIYRSVAGGAGMYWELDLGQDYPVFQVTYYNWAGSDGSRSNGMKLVVQDGEKSKAVTHTFGKGLVQVFNVQDKNAKPVPSTSSYTTPHLDNTGASQSWGTSWQYAKGRGGRLGTWAEVLAYIATAPENLTSISSNDLWVAVTDGYEGLNDEIQIGAPSWFVDSEEDPNMGTGHKQGASHQENFGVYGWILNPIDQSYNKYVFWMGPAAA